MTSENERQFNEMAHAFIPEPKMAVPSAVTAEGVLRYAEKFNKACDPVPCPSFGGPVKMITPGGSIYSPVNAEEAFNLWRDYTAEFENMTAVEVELVETLDHERRILAEMAAQWWEARGYAEAMQCREQAVGVEQAQRILWRLLYAERAPK